MQQFYKGRTNNHLTWVMVDATDFATPESALSAATTIKIYGKLRGATGTNFVSSGTGSLTNDITHVGASATGIYTIALAKADLSDASAAWYDQYIIALSATGAARQTLVVDGGIDASTILAFSDMLSDIFEVASDAHSAAILGASNASEAQSHATLAASRVLLVQSRLSDFMSAVYPSDISLMQARLVDLSAVLSDFYSDMRSVLLTTGVSLTSDTMSNIRSAIAAGPAATITVSDISAIAAAVWDEDYTIAGNNASSSFGSAFRVLASNVSDIDSMVTTMSDILSNAYSAAAQGNSRALVIQSTANNTYSALSDALSAPISASDLSDIGSAVWAQVYANHAGAGTFGSKVVGSAGVTASDIASVVWTNTPGAAAASRILRILSDTSQINSVLSDLDSNFQSRVPKAVATNSQLSDLHSDLRSHLAVTSGVVSDIYSLLSDLHSDVGVMSGVVSDIYSGLATIPASMLSAAVANPIHANVHEVNDVSLVGDGTLGNEWGPA
jgi:hypothetical protein